MGAHPYAWPDNVGHRGKRERKKTAGPWQEQAVCPLNMWCIRQGCWCGRLRVNWGYVHVCLCVVMHRNKALLNRWYGWGHVKHYNLMGPWGATPSPFIFTVLSPHSCYCMGAPSLTFFCLYGLTPVIILICILPALHVKTLCCMCCPLIRCIITQRHDREKSVNDMRWR